MKFIYDDGGRTAAGFVGKCGDCVCRAVAIASQRPYSEVYKALAEGMGSQRKSKHATKGTATARNGVWTTRKWFNDYMRSLGFSWVPTMSIGRAYERQGKSVGKLKEWDTHSFVWL